MKAKEILDTSTNRGEFNRAYKHYLEKKGKIHCSYCGYHRGENRTTKCYGGYVVRVNGHTKTSYPNWKLVSKNRKQWMKKPMVIIKEKSLWSNNVYIDIKW